MIPLTAKKKNHISRKRFVIYVKKINTDIDNSSEIMFTKYRRVRDHCHYTGQYRGAAHNICNLKYKK